MSEQATRYGMIEVESTGGVFTLTLNRPPLNILNIAMLAEIDSALEDAVAVKSAFLVFRGRGKAFSAGADVADHMPDRVEKMLAVFHSVARKLADFPGILIARVHGAALGGGCELVLPADIVLASAEASFGQPEIKLGVFPPVAAVLLPEALPRMAANEMILTGRAVTAQEALAWGLVTRVYPADVFEGKCDEYMGKLTSMSHSSLRLTKAALRKVHPDEFAVKLRAAENVYLRELIHTPDGVEGCRAFLEKRKPVWKNG